MAEKSLDILPEVYVSNVAITRLVFREVAKGNLRKLAGKVYSKNLRDEPEAIIRRNLWSVVAEPYPVSLISDRTALESAPASDGSIFLISKRRRYPSYLASPSTPSGSATTFY